MIGKSVGIKTSDLPNFILSQFGVPAVYAFAVATFIAEQDAEYMRRAMGEENRKAEMEGKFVDR